MNKPLKEYVLEQELFQENDTETIIRYLTENELELEAVDLIVSLLISIIRKKDSILQQSRSWIPQLFCNKSVNMSRYTKPEHRTNEEEQILFDRLTSYYLLGMSVPEHEIEKAKKIIPNRQRPCFIFVPMVEWLEKQYGIKFKEQDDDKK